MPRPRYVLAHPDAHEDNEEAYRRVQKEVYDVPGARIALEQWCQVDIRHVDAHGPDALFGRVVPPRLP